jgi:formamidopyrimidine-DNA glycosylase
MPELPDVEYIRRRLQRALAGATIVAARSTDRRVLRPEAPSAFGRALVGRAVREVDRRGKWLRLVLDDGGRLFSHLGMTGWWVEIDPEGPQQPSERARIDAAGPGGRAVSVRYLDARRFGRLIASSGDIPEWRALGPDPLADGVDAQRLAGPFARRRRAVKEVLMDQSVLAGIGNILATEALWHARIDPRSRSDALSRADAASVARGLRTALRREIAAREASEGDSWTDAFAVYGRAGEPCPRCGEPIARVVLGGRTTAFCRSCQVLRRRARRATARG